VLHGYTTVFWWCMGSFLAGAVILGALLRSGPLQPLVRDTQDGVAPATAGAAPDAESTAPVATPE
jgi:hypothetical protein